MLRSLLDARESVFSASGIRASADASDITEENRDNRRSKSGHHGRDARIGDDRSDRLNGRASGHVTNPPDVQDPTGDSSLNLTQSIDLGSVGAGIVGDGKRVSWNDEAVLWDLAVVLKLHWAVVVAGWPM